MRHVSRLKKSKGELRAAGLTVRLLYEAGGGGLRLKVLYDARVKERDPGKVRGFYDREYIFLRGSEA